LPRKRRGFAGVAGTVSVEDVFSINANSKFLTKPLKYKKSPATHLSSSAASIVSARHIHEDTSKKG
jgi:hypothetical protein